jgi:hypothetical protein
MGEPRADWAKELTDEFRAFKEKVTPYMTILDALKTMTTIMLVLVVGGIFAGIWRFGEVSNATTRHEKILDDIQNKLLVEVRQEIRDLAKTNRQAVDAVEEKIFKHFARVNLVLFQGTVIKSSKEMVVVRTPGNAESAFSVGNETHIMAGGVRVTNTAPIQVGKTVAVYASCRNKNEASLIEVSDVQLKQSKEPPL